MNRRMLCCKRAVSTGSKAFSLPLLCGIGRPTRPLLSRAFRVLDASDPFGEKASLGEQDFILNRLSDIDPAVLESITEQRAVHEGVFAQDDTTTRQIKVRRSFELARKKDGLTADAGIATEDAPIGIDPEIFAALSAEERQVLIAQQLSDEDRRVAETLPNGITEWLSLSPAARLSARKDFLFSESNRLQKDVWKNKSYTSYEEYVRREVIGVTEEDIVNGSAENHLGGATIHGSPAATTAACSEEPTADFEDDEVEESAAKGIPLPNLTSARATSAWSVADKTIEDADAIRHELKEMAEASAQMTSESTAEKEDTIVAPDTTQQQQGGPYQLPSTDPSKWSTDDVIAWLDCFVEDGVMDEEMIKTFRMANVDGEMLLNKVMPPNLFKIMRKWHLHRSNPKTRHLAEELVVEAEVVQYTIYLCFPYCGQMS